MGPTVSMWLYTCHRACRAHLNSGGEFSLTRVRALMSPSQCPCGSICTDVNESATDPFNLFLNVFFFFFFFFFKYTFSLYGHLEFVDITHKSRLRSKKMWWCMNENGARHVLIRLSSEFLRLHVVSFCWNMKNVVVLSECFQFSALISESKWK